ncbi:gamma-glutamyltransferase 5a [Triplophysa rosa]|uniref:Glutathione hydrolase n=1 Tax=Triplophysa rosa TaxID=992332 RepID=A0A9W7TI66_TRIRA|nr:gamma-glutamyltransferase 5a [Triplophysa rosa]KAI7797772.1 putative gamma-glutamyltransferase 5 [Triplophysa rosa]
MPRRKERTCLFISIPVICIVIVTVVCVARFKQQCSDGLFKNAAVAADSETCSKIGRDILKSGGSAVDGAIATLVCTSIINPQSMGIGGGSIFTIMEKSGKVRVISCRETVPKGFKPNLLAECPETFQPKSGVHWIGVPGEIRGYERAHKLYGRLPWYSLFQPTIKMAREGVPVGDALARFLPVLSKESPESPLRQLFQNDQGELLKKGDIVKFEKLAETLEIIAQKGPDAFYIGDIGKNLVSDIQAAGGAISMEDLKSFKVSESDAWDVTLGQYDMYFPPPPAGGATLSFILNTMLGHNLNRESLQGKEKVLTFQRYVEACKFANGLKKFMKDPNFSSQTEAVEIIQKHFAEKVRAKITSDRTHDVGYYNVTPYLDSHGTTHVSVIAEDGMAVSVTSTINYIFGSTVLSPKTGVLLNNELIDFCGKTDQIHAGEQPPSSMSPVILHSPSEKHTVVIGASGGSMITTGVALTIMNFLWFGKNLKDSIAAPVVYVDSKNILSFEPSFDEAVVEALTKTGHKILGPRMFYNVVNAVSKEENCIDAVSDLRKMGKAAGY